MNWYYRLGNAAFAWIVAALQKTAEEGAYSTVHVVSAPLGDLSYWNKGSFVVNCSEQAANPYVEGPSGAEDAKRLWDWSERELSAAAAETTISASRAEKGEKKEQ